MRHISIVFFFIALLFCASTSALCADIYLEQWDGGTTAGWGPATPPSTVAIDASGGSPGGCLSIYGISNDATRIGAAAAMPGATGDYWAKGIGIVSFDVKFVGESSMQGLLRIRSAGGPANGWLFRLPLAAFGVGTWSAFTTGLNPAWDDAEAILAGWIKEMNALSFHETMAQVAAVEVLFLSQDAVDARIDNFRLGSSMQCMEDLPEPVLAFKGTSVAGDFEIRWNFAIENWYDFPGELFLLEPELPPCGRNRGAPRTYVRFFRSNGRALAELCTVTDPSQLQDIGFIADLDGAPKMYVELYDRYCNLVYRSNIVSTGFSNSAPNVYAGEDVTLECSGATTPVTVDGSRSVDPDGDEVTFEWYAKDIVFDDPSAPVTVGNFPVGTHLVVLKVSDDFTYKTDVVQVKVVDTRPPDLRVELSRSILWPPNHKYFDIHADISANDCDSSPDVALLNIFWKGGAGQGEFDMGNAVRSAELGTMDADFQLLSERKGWETGGMYGIVFMAWDAMFHVAVETVYVQLPHDQSGHALAAAGFDAAGTSFDRSSPHFALVVPSEAGRGAHAGFDASAVVAKDAQVGTSKGALSPVAAYFGDVTGDGMDDILLFYSTVRAGQLLHASDDGEELSFYCRNTAGDIYTVPDIFALGEPMPVSMANLRLVEGYSAVALKESGRQGPRLSDAPPSGPSLDQAYPNPFNPVVNLTYSIPAGGTVKLAVFDVSGRAVRRLVSTQKPAGTFTTTWNALDDGGMQAPAGVYFVRFQFGNTVQTRKIVLLH